MNISSLLNPASSTGTDRDGSLTSSEYHDRTRQEHSHHFGPRYEQDTDGTGLVHPQPVRPVMAQSNLDNIPDSRHLPQPAIRSPAGPVHQMYTPRTQCNPGQAIPSYTARPPPRLDTSTEGLNRIFSWQANDPIPQGMRLTVPSYVTVREPPHHQRILIPEHESAESLRPFLERPIPTCYTDQPVEHCNQPEHSSALLRMKEPDPIPFSHPVTKPEHPTDDTPSADSGSPPPQPPPSTAAVAAAANAELAKQQAPDKMPSIDETLIANTDKEVTLTEFEEVLAHTAKCDLCNSRNSGGMSRCLACGWQSCHLCTVSRGCYRTHPAGAGRIHTGPIKEDDLVMPEKPKSKKAGKLRVMKDTAARKTGKLTRKSAGGGKSQSRKSSAGSSGGGISKSENSGSDTEALLAGAQTLYSLGTAAFEGAENEAAEADGSRLKKEKYENTSEGDSLDSDSADPDYEPMETETGMFARKVTRRGAR